MRSKDTRQRKQPPATPRPGRHRTPPGGARRPTTTEARSPQLGLRDADVVRELTATSR